MNRDMSQPVVIEYEAGKIKVYADPESENWIGETARIELYEDILEEMKDALSNKNNKKLKNLLSDVRDLPLFGQDTSNVWKISQIDGIENYGESDVNVMSAAEYAIQKIQYFLKWAKDNQK
jgi:hypothetical protein